MSSDRAVTAGPRRRLWPRRGPVAMLGVVLALSLVMVAAAAAPARSQDDAPVEDSQDAPSEDAEAETPEEPPDAPAEDGPAANEPPDAPDEGVTDDEAGPLAPSTEGSQPFLAPGFVAVAAGWRPPVLDWPLALVPPVPQVDVPSLAALLGTDLAPCPPRPSSPFVDTDPYPGGWCREPSYWVVEVVCGPQHADAGVTVRFNADPGVVGPLTLDDVCGGADRVAACRAPEPEAPAAEDAAAAPPAAEDAGDVAHLRSAIDATSPADACAPLWPPGAWYQFTSRDPIGGSTTSGGGHTGSWLGSPPPAAAAGPSLGLRCPGRRLEAVVHTGGAFTGSHGWGIPVDYRIGGSLRFQEWAPLGAVAGSGPGVSLPPLFAADFAGLLAANPSGEFHFRLYGPDGAEFGTALFDLAAIREVVRPMREHCPALAAPLADAATVATAPAPEEG